MREYVFLLAALALGAGAADPLHEHEDGTDHTGHTRVQREVQGLFPFPRVGRAAWASWATRDSENKRQGLIPFPRVGRSENAEPRGVPLPLAVPRAVPAAWLVAPDFYPGKRVPSSWVPSSSPRLGRQSKRFDADRDSAAAWTLVNLREYPAMNRPQRGRDSASFTPRLGRELESDEEVGPLGHDGPVAGLGLGLGAEDAQSGVRL